MRVDELELPDGVIEVLQEEGIVELHPPQAKAVPFALDGKNLMLAIPTASGKAWSPTSPRRTAGMGGRRCTLWLEALASEKLMTSRSSRGWASRWRCGRGPDSSDLSWMISNNIVATEKANPAPPSERMAGAHHLVVADEVHLIHDPQRSTLR